MLTSWSPVLHWPEVTRARNLQPYQWINSPRGSQVEWTIRRYGLVGESRTLRECPKGYCLVPGPSPWLFLLPVHCVSWFIPSHAPCHNTVPHYKCRGSRTKWQVNVPWNREPRGIFPSLSSFSLVFCHRTKSCHDIFKYLFFIHEDNFNTMVHILPRTNCWELMVAMALLKATKNMQHVRQW